MLNNKFSMEVCRSKIKKVSLVGEMPTFDLTVEDDHSYVANGVITHNTSRYRHIGVNI